MMPFFKYASNIYLTKKIIEAEMSKYSKSVNLLENELNRSHRAMRDFERTIRIIDAFNKRFR